MATGGSMRSGRAWSVIRDRISGGLCKTYVIASQLIAVRNVQKLTTGRIK